jgi:hypothetical protein
MMEFPGFTQLFAISDPLSKKAFRGNFQPIEESLMILRGETSPQIPPEVTWHMRGDVPGDVIWASDGISIVVGPRVIEILQEGKFRGWQSHPVHLTGKEGEQFDGFAVLSLTGRCGPTDYRRSEIVMRKQPNKTWVPHVRGRFFEPSSWDGSDLFMEHADEQGKATGHKYVTAAVAKALRAAKVGNIALTPLSDVEVWLTVLRHGSQHRLPEDLDARIERARAAIVD